MGPARGGAGPSQCQGCYSAASLSARLERIYLEEVIDSVSVRGAQRWFVPAPALEQVGEGRTGPQDLVRRSARERDVPVLDLLPAIEASDSSRSRFLEGDNAPWNASGHRLVAQTTADFLERYLVDEQEVERRP